MCVCIAGLADSFDVFISYNHSNTDIVHQINAQLKKEGFVVWIDTENTSAYDSSTITALLFCIRF